jgi:hypothetical protein
MPRHDRCRKDNPKAAPEGRSNLAARFSAGLARTMTQVPEGRPTFAPICAVLRARPSRRHFRVRRIFPLQQPQNLRNQIGHLERLR